jgi:hypothetical protein
VGAQGIVDEDEERELSLGGERGLGFVEQEKTVALELMNEESKEAFAV